MANYQQVKSAADTQQDESIFLVRVIWIMDEPGVLIVENGSGLFE
jgi:hypothetical protein